MLLYSRAFSSFLLFNFWRPSFHSISSQLSASVVTCSLARVPKGNGLPLHYFVTLCKFPSPNNWKLVTSVLKVELCTWAVHVLVVEFPWVILVASYRVFDYTDLLFFLLFSNTVIIPLTKAHSPVRMTVTRYNDTTVANVHYFFAWFTLRWI